MNPGIALKIIFPSFITFYHFFFKTKQKRSSKWSLSLLACKLELPLRHYFINHFNKQSSYLFIFGRTHIFFSFAYLWTTAEFCIVTKIITKLLQHLVTTDHLQDRMVALFQCFRVHHLSQISRLNTTFKISIFLSFLSWSIKPHTIITIMSFHATLS